jgi:hypothetical protein
MPPAAPPATLFQVAKRAIETSYPLAPVRNWGYLLAKFEDADEPATAIQNLEERVALTRKPFTKLGIRSRRDLSVS